MGTVNVEEHRSEAGRFASVYGVTPELHSEDHMLRHFLEQNADSGNAGSAIHFYFKGGHSDAEQLMLAFNALGLDLKNMKVLEFASGYGRLTRHLNRLCKLSVCDIHQEAIDFVKQHVGCPAYLSSPDPEALDIPERFNAVAVISLFSHLPDRTFGRWLKALYDLLEPGGFLLFTTIGDAAREINPGVLAPGPDGYAFAAGSEQLDLDTAEYGSTTVRPHYVGFQIGKWLPGSRLISYEPGVWWKYQDQYVVQKPASDH